MSTGVLPIMERLSRFADLEEDDKEARSIRSTAKTNSAFLSVDPIRKCLSRSDFAFAELRQNPITTTYVVIPGEYAQSLYPFSRLIIESGMRELMHQPSGRPVLFLIDEMPLLQRMEILETIIAMGAGLNIRTWCLAQDIHQLKSLYPETYQSFLANAGAQQWFTPATSKVLNSFRSVAVSAPSWSRTNRRARSRFKRRRKDLGGSVIHTRPTRAHFYLPQEIMAMSKDRQLLFMDNVDNVIVARRRPYWEIPELDGRFDANPYHPKR